MRGKWFHRPLLVAFPLIFALALNAAPSRADWQFESDNNRTGISTYASSFWAQGYGPVSYSKLMNISLDEGDYWGILTISCVRKKLNVVITVNISGSGNDGIRFDNPGYINISLSGIPTKKYRTMGSEYGDTIYLTSTDSKTLVKSMMTKSYLAVAPRIKFSSKKVAMFFDISGLSKAKTRFRYAGCSI
jgi:hypothetical protein